MTDEGIRADPLKLEVTLDTWPHWLEIAIRHWQKAAQAHADLIAALARDDEEALHVALNEEFQQSMQAISAAAFALDGLYGSLVEQSATPGEIRTQWEANGTPRAGRLLATIQRVARLRNREVRSLKTGLTSVFRVRNWAVHPPRDFRAPIHHADIEAGVDWRFVTYTESSAQAAVTVAIEALMRTFENVRPSFEQLKTWAERQSQILTELLAEADINVITVEPNL